jgi:cytoskeletal protein CcmA (bactofilin family)
MKFKLFLAMILSVALLAACGSDDTSSDDTTDEGTDATTAASFADDGEALKEAASENGTWIIIPTQDMTVEGELVVAGEFRNGGEEDGDIYRKIAAYTQDDERNIIDQWTITTDRLVVQSENLNFQGGILEGDVYVEANGFQLHETATVTGDVVFANADYEASATLDGTVEGEVSVEE